MPQAEPSRLSESYRSPSSSLPTIKTTAQDATVWLSCLGWNSAFQSVQRLHKSGVHKSRGCRIFGCRHFSTVLKERKRETEREGGGGGRERGRVRCNSSGAVESRHTYTHATHARTHTHVHTNGPPIYTAKFPEGEGR